MKIIQSRLGWKERFLLRNNIKFIKRIRKTTFEREHDNAAIKEQEQGCKRRKND